VQIGRSKTSEKESKSQQQESDVKSRGGERKGFKASFQVTAERKVKEMANLSTGNTGTSPLRGRFGDPTGKARDAMRSRRSLKQKKQTP